MQHPNTHPVWHDAGMPVALDHERQIGGALGRRASLRVPLDETTRDRTASGNPNLGRKESDTAAVSNLPVGSSFDPCGVDSDTQPNTTIGSCGQLSTAAKQSRAHGSRCDSYHGSYFFQSTASSESGLSNVAQRQVRAFIDAGASNKTGDDLTGTTPSGGQSTAGFHEKSCVPHTHGPVYTVQVVGFPDAHPEVSVTPTSYGGIPTSEKARTGKTIEQPLRSP